VFEQLADSFSYAKEKVVVAKVDADAHRELGQRFGVTGIACSDCINGRISHVEGVLLVIWLTVVVQWQTIGSRGLQVGPRFRIPLQLYH
jgi:hypothetical protein